MNIDLLRAAGDLSAHLVPLGANLFLQSTLLLAAGLLVAHLCRQRGPALQSTILRATLVAVITCPLASLLFGLAGIAGGRLSLPQPGTPATAATVQATSQSTAPTTSTPASAAAAPAAAPAAAVAAVMAAPTSTLPPTAAAPASVRRDERSALALTYAAFAGLWVVGAGFFLTRLAVCHQRIARMRRESDLPEVAVFETCGGLARELAIPSPEIRLHRELKSPLLVGLFRPAILLPDVKDLESLVASREVLVHELAHRIRGDCFWHLLSRLVTAILWFQPLLWMLARRIEESGEEVCDNYVIAQVPNRQAYAHQLVQLADHLQYSSTEALAGTGVIAFRSALGQRVVRILDASRNLSIRIGARAAISIIVGSTLATGAVGLIGVALRAEPETGPRMTVRRLLANATNAGENLTADGKYIRGLDWETGDVVQFDVASGEKSRIKNQGSWSEQDKTYEAQVLSPDGGQIAYSSYAKDWTPQLQVRNLDGSSVRTLYREKGAYVYALSWSPDAGSILALRSRNKANELTAIALTDGTVRVLKALTAHIYMCSDARFSPDGRYVAFDLVREGSPAHSDVFLMAADGHDEVSVAQHPAEDRLVGWSPDGSRLVFRSDRSGTWDLWSVAIKEGNPQGSPTMLKRDFGPGSAALGFAPDGSCFYTITTETGGLYRGAVNFETGKVTEPPASVALRYTGRVATPVWSPDGRHLLYVANRAGIGPGKNILTIRNADSGTERFLSPSLRFVNFAWWSPDGRSVLALGISEKERGLFRIDAETSEMTRLSEHGYFPRLTPDGKTLVYTFDGTLRRRNLDTGKESEVITAGKISRFDLSPDGREVVYQQGDIVMRASLDGGEPRELARGLAKNLRMKWTSDGRHIVAFPWNMKTSKIWFIPAHGGTPLQMDLSIPKMEHFALHPDNRRFVYSVSEESKTELWVLENFLPKATLAAR